jgi:cyclopropane-fatty-acyl-phospholipid synthase
MLLARLSQALLRDGALTLIDADGTTYRLGRAGRPVDLVVRLHDPRLGLTLPLRPARALADAYAGGALTLDRGDLYDLCDLCARNLARLAASPGARAFDGVIDRALRLWPGAGAAPSRPDLGAPPRHPAADLPDELGDCFLDRDRQRSSAYFADPDADLSEAQEAQRQHLAAKLLLRPGQRVLEVGSGFGGLALHLAREGGVDVTGLVRSEAELAVSRRRAAEQDLAGQASFHLRGLDRETGRYDRVVSIGGLPRGASGQRAFFARLREVLTEDGVAVVHGVGRAGGADGALPWLRPPLFPAGRPPALSEVLGAVEQARLWVTDVEILRLHYAETLRRWRLRLVAGWERAAALHGERPCRRLEVDLCLAEAGFRHAGLMVYEIQLARRKDAVPLTRDYLHDEAPLPAPAPPGPWLSPPPGRSRQGHSSLAA